MDLAIEIYSIANLLPSQEDFNLKAQLNRCAVSIPSNIAEGSGRDSNKSFIHFLNISISSAFELETQLYLIHRLYQVEIEEVLEKVEEIQKMIRSFSISLNKV